VSVLEVVCLINTPDVNKFKRDLCETTAHVLLISLRNRRAPLRRGA
jgi:hypothetical protein